MKYNILLIVFSFLLVSFDRSRLIPKEGTYEYIEFVSGEYKLLSFRIDALTEETIMTLHDVKGKFSFEIRQKFERQSPLTTRTKEVYILTCEIPHVDVTERKFFVNYIGIDEKGNHIWNHLCCVYIPKKIQKENKKKTTESVGSAIVYIPPRWDFLFYDVERVK